MVCGDIVSLPPARASSTVKSLSDGRPTRRRVFPPPVKSMTDGTQYRLSSHCTYRTLPSLAEDNVSPARGRRRSVFSCHQCDGTVQDTIRVETIFIIQATGFKEDIVHQSHSLQVGCLPLLWVTLCDQHLPRPWCGQPHIHLSSRCLGTDPSRLMPFPRLCSCTEICHMPTLHAC